MRTMRQKDQRELNLGIGAASEALSTAAQVTANQPPLVALNGSTTTQNPSAARAAPESAGLRCVAEVRVGVECDAVRVMSRNSLLTSLAV